MTSLRLKGVQPLFYSPLSVFELEDAESLNVQLLAEALACRDASPGLDRSNWQGWHSEDDFFDRTESGCRMLRDHIIQAVQVCTKNVSPNFDFAQYPAVG